MTIRTLIVDDEPVARRGLARHLSEQADVQIVGQCGDGEGAIAAIAELAPDLVFLDVQMPGLSGFDVIDAVGLVRMPPTIFVTAFDQYAVRAFDVHAIDYVLKPIDAERFRRALDRARRQIGLPISPQASSLAAAFEDLGCPAPPRHAKRLAIKSTGRTLLVEVRDVDRIEAAGNYLEVHVGTTVHLLRETLANLESRLDPERFVRVSRSTLVSIDRVRELQPMFNGDFVVILKNGTRISGSRRYREALDRLIG